MPGSAGRLVDWQGPSGRHYDLVGESLDDFTMRDADLYLITKGSHVLWVGSNADLVADPASRARFRLALDCGNQVFRLAAPPNGPAVIWDLEGAAPASPPSAQAA